MISVSSLYEQILATEGHIKTYKVLIENNSGTKIEYTDSNLISAPKISMRLFTDDVLSVGGVGSAKLEFELVPTSETIKKMAEIDVYVRLEYGTQVSEWVPQGVYFIYTREIEPASVTHPLETIKITAYDAMSKADTFLINIDDSLQGWPKKMNTLVSEICTDLGVTLETGTVISSSMECEADYSYTRRDYLSAIAKAHGGNWIITYDGKLRLVRLFSEYCLLSTENHVPITFGGVAILV